MHRIVSHAIQGNKGLDGRPVVFLQHGLGGSSVGVEFVCSFCFILFTLNIRLGS